MPGNPVAADDGRAPDDRVVVLGRIGAPWGVRGWVRINSWTDPREAILDYRDCLLKREGAWQPARLASGKPQGRSLVGQFDGMDDRDAASAWRGADIGVRRSAMPDPEAGRWYWSDLEGLTVRHRDGRELGRVAYLLATGEHDVLVVQGEREVLIPFVHGKYVLDVDLAGGRIDVDWEWD